MPDIRPYTGPAPEPARERDMQTGVTTDVPVAPPAAPPQPTQPTADAYQASMDPGAQAQPAADFSPDNVQFSRPPAVPGQTMSTPPPADPQGAVNTAEARADYGRIVGKLGEMEERHSREMAQRDFQHEMAMANLQMQMQQRPPQNGNAEEFDPDSGMTKGEFLVAAQGLQNQIAGQNQALLIRSSWGVTPQMEQHVLQSYPHLQNYPEPQKTALIQRAAAAFAPGAQRPQAPAPAPSPSTGIQSAPVQPAAGVTPYVEHGQMTPPAPDMGPTDPTREALAEYEQAKNIRDPKERVDALRAATRKALGAQGIDMDQFVAAGFTAKG